MTESSASATERVGRYQLLEPIGSGPTGTTWRGKVFGVAGFERQFAVKRFLPELTSSPAGAQALSTGARAYGGLEHPRIARMTEFGVAQGHTFTAVELVAGMDAMRLVAEVRLAGTTLSPGGALGLVSQVARAIGYAHGRGISHLGLAPTNVIVTPEGDVKVTDFAILAATLPPRPTESPRLAKRLAFLAPEQLAGEATSAATDVFALGVLAYELVTGERTFAGDTAAQVAAAVLGGPPREPALPRPIVRVLARCFARSPFERFADARAFADALDAALRVAPVPGTRKDIGATVQAALERVAELRDNQLSGMLALHVGTAPAPAPRVTTDDIVASLGRQSLEVVDSSATAPDLPKLTTTVPGLAPPPRGPPAMPAIPRPASSTQPPPSDPPTRKRPPTDTGAGRATPGGRVEIPPVAAARRAPSEPLAPELVGAELGADLAALAADLPPALAGDPTEPIEMPVPPRTRSRGMLDARTEPGVGIRPTAPHVADAEPAPSRAAREMPTDEISPILGGALGAASTKPTSEIPPLVADAHLADALAEFPDEHHTTHRADDVDAASALFGAPAAKSGLRDGAAPPVTTRPGMPPPAPPRAQTPAPGRADSELDAPRTKPRRWPWVVGSVLTLAVLGGVGYFVLQTLADDSDIVEAEAALHDAGAHAPSLDAAAHAVAAPDAAQVAIATPRDAAAAVAAPDAAAAAARDATIAPAARDAAIAPTAAADAATAVPILTPSAPGDGLAIDSTPSGARLYLDGADQGVTPVKLAGSGDHHTAVLLLPGHDLYVAEVSGHGAFTIPLKEVTPSNGPAGIKVLKCAKDRYYVSVDGKPTGQLCPTERIGCDLGPHTVETYDAVTGVHRKWDIVVTDTRLSFRVRVE